MKRVIGATIVVALLLVLAGVYEAYGEYSAASSLSYNMSLRQPSLSYRFGQGLDVSAMVDFTNPTSHSTPPFSATFDIYLDGIFIGSGSIAETTVHAGATISTPISATLRLGDVGFALLYNSYSQGGALTEIIQGTILAKAFGIIPISVPFERSQ